MKTKIRSWLTVLMIAVVGGVLCPPVQAQIDFSALDKWRGWRPSDPSPRSQRPDSRERPVQQASENTWRPPDPKEVERMEKLKNERLRQLQTHWFSVANQTTVVIPVATVHVNSPGSTTFGVAPSNPVSFVAPLGIAMQRTKIPTESLRRTLAILNAAKSAGSPEEAAFLAGEAAHSMEGAPLQVIVSPGALPQADVAEATRPVLEQIGQKQAELERAERTRHEATVEYKALLKKEASPENTARKAELETVFKRTSGQIDDAKKNLTKYEIIMVHKN